MALSTIASWCVRAGQAIYNSGMAETDKVAAFGRIFGYDQKPAVTPTPLGKRPAAASTTPAPRTRTRTAATTASGTDLQEAIYKALSVPLALDTLASLLDKRPAAVGRSLKTMIEAGRITETNGLYSRAERMQKAA